MVETFQGATVVGLKFSNGAVIAGEERMTYGTFIMSSQAKKVYLINERLGAGTAGLMGDTQNIIRIFREEIRYYETEIKSKMSTKSAAKLLSNILYSYRGFPLYGEFILAGIDDKKPTLVVLDPAGSVLEDEYMAIGTGGPVAIGVLEELYQQNIDEKTAIDLAIRAVKQGVRRDAMSGGSIDYVVISDRGSYEGSVKQI
ncbi:proteasome subunit beta [Fervidicoccus fontis]|uniref:Proteasome subunit beta n=1 Tax=Fervidicoccus fontis TaxID=683846 RepID=A0A2J6N2Q3_9CREN|nr:proteasome subunit beta [Fervidicoccus fontis]MBE9390983.1 proteasome subunit beta [Fervidicoccus fontis]PMB75367.1 MAG: proteasome subunit beta [Fervidicoccus fontis]PMB75493.1 MAG: proteasome subunit beta [Fervidicoccus fontis]PMB76259.1 MAG: proteasome subunit beta [Fervidicoccus fontis]PMB78048.1 MAG: proteasome subunit beta [Fervidicoccus fontis]